GYVAGHGVDVEVATLQLRLDASGAHLGERARPRVALAARGGDVHPRKARPIGSGATLDRRGAERRMQDKMPPDLLAEAPGEGDAVLLHDEVEIGHLIRVASPHKIAHDATRCVDGVPMRLAKLPRRAEKPEPRVGGGALEPLELAGQRRTGFRRSSYRADHASAIPHEHDGRPRLH